MITNLLLTKYLLEDPPNYTTIDSSAKRRGYVCVMRQAMRESAVMAPPLHAVGARVAVTFQNHTKRFAGLVTACRSQPSGRPLYDVDFDDGEHERNLPEEELKPGPAVEAAEEWIEAILPNDTEVARVAREQAWLPTPNLPDEIQPGGSSHCGGDLCFPNMTLAHEPGRYRMPLFMMQPRAVALFSGCDSCHCTTEHHDRSQRRPGCEAHVSFAVQTPASVLGMSSRADDRQELHRELLELGTADVRKLWSDAVWVPVWHFKETPAPHARLGYTEQHMCVLPWQRVVLYDVELGRDDPRSMLVAYDMEGGLSAETASHARKHFDFLTNDWSFKLDRHNTGSERSGCLHLDGRGEQRMEMLGIHDRRRNSHKPPDLRRPGMTLAHREGDLDAYVVHSDHPERFGSNVVKPIFNAISARLHALLPSATSRLAAALEHERVRERLYTTMASGVISDDLVVNNVGVSSEYQSPPHFDVADMGWTAAFSGVQLAFDPRLPWYSFCKAKTSEVHTFLAAALPPLTLSKARCPRIVGKCGECGECGECPSTTSSCVHQPPHASVVPAIFMENHAVCETPWPPPALAAAEIRRPQSQPPESPAVLTLLCKATPQMLAPAPPAIATATDPPISPLIASYPAMQWPPSQGAPRGLSPGLRLSSPRDTPLGWPPTNGMPLLGMPPSHSLPNPLSYRLPFQPPLRPLPPSHDQHTMSAKQPLPSDYHLVFSHYSSRTNRRSWDDARRRSPKRQRSYNASARSSSRSPPRQRWQYARDRSSSRSPLHQRSRYARDRSPSRSPPRQRSRYALDRSSSRSSRMLIQASLAE